MRVAHFPAFTFTVAVVVILLWTDPAGAAAGAHPVSPRELLKVFKSSNSESVPDATVDSRYPFLVQVQGANGEFCSGALINPLTVLTAAHCVPPTRTKGEWQQASFLVTARAGTEQAADYSASWYVRHPDFNPAPEDSGFGYVQNDVALIRLDECALSPEYATLPCKGGSACGLPGDVYAYGWGRMSDESGVPYQVRRAGPYAAGCGCTSPGQMPDGMEETFFCLYEVQEKPDGPQEICQGDSGGPNLLEAADLKVVIGVNSFGDGATCGSRRRKNAGYSADLTNPSINKWICQFASKEELQAVARVCPAAGAMAEANREVGPSAGQARMAPPTGGGAAKDTGAAKGPRKVGPQPTATVQDAVMVDSSGRQVRLSCGPGLTCKTVASSAARTEARVMVLAGMAAGAVFALL